MSFDQVKKQQKGSIEEQARQKKIFEAVQATVELFKHYNLTHNQASNVLANLFIMHENQTIGMLKAKDEEIARLNGIVNKDDESIAKPPKIVH